MEALYYALKVQCLLIVSGFSFTVGMWCFCKLFTWAPVNITINANVNNYND